MIGLRRTPLLVLALFLVGCATAETPVTLRTTGGDAWSFHKLVAASVAPGACDLVAFTSPLGTVNAEPQGGHVLGRVPLQPAHNTVRATCHSAGVPRGSAAQQHWFVRLEDLPKAWVRTTVAGRDITLDGGASEPAPARAAPLHSYEWRAGGGNPAPLAGLPAEGKRIVVPAPDVDGEYAVTVRVTDALGRADESAVLFRVRNGRPQAVDPDRDAPAWVERAVVYGVVPFFFGPRGFDGVTARLDELAALGVTVLWLSPLTASPPDDFGYAVTDNFRLRTAFGSEADFRRLVDAAHARGLRVIMDFVPNHLSEQSDYFADVAARQRSSPYYDFFERTPTGEPAHYFEWRNLKNLNYDNPEVQRLIIEAFAHWLREYDVDGFRVDVAWGPRQRAPEFWPRWRAELKRIKPDLLLLAEASVRDAYYFHNGFDAAYDWTDKLGEWAWREAFDDEPRTARRLRATIAQSGVGADRLTYRFLNNNDTGERFITRYGLPRTRVAAAMLLTLPGMPGLYSGDEIGAAFEPYDEGPPIVWRDDHGLRPWYRRLIGLRQAYPALRSREVRLLDMAPTDQVLAYLRPGTHGADPVVVLLNYGAQRLRVTLPGDAMSPGRWVDLLTGEEFAVDGGPARLRLDSHGVRILRPAEPASSGAM